MSTLPKIIIKNTLSTSLTEDQRVVLAKGELAVVDPTQHLGVGDGEHMLKDLDLVANISDVNVKRDKTDLAVYDANGVATADMIAKLSEVNDKINKSEAHYITRDANGNPFTTFDELSSALSVYYVGSLHVPDKNDYAVVLSDENHFTESGFPATTRYVYNCSQESGQWQYQYTVNETPFSQAQWDAIRSGITSSDWLSAQDQIRGSAKLSSARFTGPVSINDVPVITSADISADLSDIGDTFDAIELDIEGLCSNIQLCASSLCSNIEGLCSNIEGLCSNIELCASSLCSSVGLSVNELHDVASTKLNRAGDLVEGSLSAQKILSADGVQGNLIGSLSGFVTDGSVVAKDVAIMGQNSDHVAMYHDPVTNRFVIDKKDANARVQLELPNKFGTLAVDGEYAHLSGDVIDGSLSVTKLISSDGSQSNLAGSLSGFVTDGSVIARDFSVRGKEHDDSQDSASIYQNEQGEFVLDSNISGEHKFATLPSKSGTLLVDSDLTSVASKSDLSSLRNVNDLSVYVPYGEWELVHVNEQCGDVQFWFGTQGNDLLTIKWQPTKTGQYKTLDMIAIHKAWSAEHPETEFIFHDAELGQENTPENYVCTLKRKATATAYDKLVLSGDLSAKQDTLKTHIYYKISTLQSYIQAPEFLAANPDVYVVNQLSATYPGKVVISLSGYNSNVYGAEYPHMVVDEQAQTVYFPMYNKVTSVNPKFSVNLDSVYESALNSQVDVYPTAGSNRLITSGAVYQALANFTPTSNSGGSSECMIRTWTES